MQADFERSRPRVAVISQGLGWVEPPHAYGAVSIWTYEAARRLAKDTSLLLIEFGKERFATRTAKHEGMTLAYLPTFFNRVTNGLHRRFARFANAFRSASRRVRRPDYASPFHNLGFILHASWYARRWRSNIIHIHNFSQFVPIVRALNPRARIVLHMHCEWLSQHDPKMIRARLRRADAVICCSGYIRRRLLEVFPDLRDKSFVVFNGADVERFRPRSSESAAAPSPLRILFVGRVSPEKGVHVLVEAFARLAERQPLATLEIVGPTVALQPEFLVGLSSDPLVRQLEHFYRSDYLVEVRRFLPDGLKDRVNFHGSVTHDELAELCRSAAVFVSASFSDAFPLTVIEAMGAGLPVVASAVGGIPEAVIDGETGFLVEPGNVEALAASLQHVLEDHALRRRMGAAGRIRALDLFSWEAINKQLIRVYFAKPQDIPVGGEATVHNNA